MKLQTMPLRFRVWDKELKCFVRYKDIYDDSYDQSKTELEVIDLAHYFYNTDEKAENVIISQDTGHKTSDGKSIYMGDILDYGIYDNFGVKKKNVLVNMGELHDSDGYNNGAIWGIRAGWSSLIDILQYAPETKIISNVWQNPELLEED